MSGDYSMWKRQEERVKQRQGLTQRGLFGCVSFLISIGVAYGLYWWVEREKDLYRLFNIPREWPDWLVGILAVLVLTVAFQAVITIISGVFWRLAGKDKKVGEKMDEMLAKWDEIDY